MNRSVQESLVQFALGCYRDFYEHPQAVTLSPVMFNRLCIELQRKGRYFVSVADSNKIELFIPSYGKLDVIKGEPNVFQIGTK